MVMAGKRNGKADAVEGGAESRQETRAARAAAARARARLAAAAERQRAAERGQRVVAIAARVSAAQADLEDAAALAAEATARVGDGVRGLIGEGLTVDQVAELLELEPRDVRRMASDVVARQRLVESDRLPYQERPDYVPGPAVVMELNGVPDPRVSGTPVPDSI